MSRLQRECFGMSADAADALADARAIQGHLRAMPPGKNLIRMETFNDLEEPRIRAYLTAEENQKVFFSPLFKVTK